MQRSQAGLMLPFNDAVECLIKLLGSALDVANRNTDNLLAFGQRHVEALLNGLDREVMDNAILKDWSIIDSEKLGGKLSELHL